MYMCIHMYKYEYIYIYIYIYIHIYILYCICICLCIYIYIYVKMCVYATYACMYVETRFFQFDTSAHALSVAGSSRSLRFPGHTLRVVPRPLGLGVSGDSL